MKHALTAAWVLFLFSVPLWMDDLYILHVLIVTGIFIIAAMSLNLLLGYGGDDTLDLGLGSDRGYGGDGNDTIFAKDGSTLDTIDGGDGWDTVERDRSYLMFYLIGGGGRIRYDSAVNCEVYR